MDKSTPWQLAPRDTVALRASLTPLNPHRCGKCGTPAAWRIDTLQGLPVTIYMCDECGDNARRLYEVLA